MRRLPILLVFALMLALLALAPASADPPNCEELPFEHPHYCGLPCDQLDVDDPNYCETPPTTEPPVEEVEECVFTDDNELEGWVPPESYRCQWTIPFEEQGKIFEFTLEPDSPDATVNLPHLIVTDVFPYGGQICFNEYEVGWNPLSYSWTKFTLPEGDSRCELGGGDAPHEANVFAITIDVIKVKNGEVKLTYTTTTE